MYQNAIGHRTFVEGCITRKWKKIQIRHQTFIKTRNSALRQWTKKLIIKTWRMSWEMCYARNGIVNNDQTTQHQQIKTGVDEAIRQIHARAQDDQYISTAVRSFFSRRMQDILDSTEYQKRTWKRLGERYHNNNRNGWRQTEMRLSWQTNYPKQQDPDTRGQWRRETEEARKQMGTPTGTGDNKGKPTDTQKDGKTT